MSEERFDRIDQRLDRVDERFDQIDRWQSRADERLERIDTWQSRADQRFADLTADVRRIDARLEHLHQRIGVLHEDVLSRIAGAGESRGPTKREMDQGFADLREAIDRRLDPLEATVRLHSREIDSLKKKRR